MFHLFEFECYFDGEYKLSVIIKEQTSFCNNLSYRCIKWFHGHGHQLKDI